MIRRSATVATLGVAAAGVYWRHMSSYSQALGHFPYRAHSDPAGPPQVALTFDDGPNEPFTSQIAALLADRGVVGTFFQVGRCVERHRGLSRELVAAGHVVGNHSYSHAFTKGWTTTDIRHEIASAQEVLTDELGKAPLLYRPPWLIRTRGLFEVLGQQGMNVVSGEFCHPLEPFQPSARRIAARTLSAVRPGGIVIFHDGYDDKGGARAETVAAVEIVVDSLLGRGFAFTTVDRLLGLPAYRAEGAVVRRPDRSVRARP